MDLNWLSSWFQLSPIPADRFVGNYTVSLVILSFIIASLGSYVALDLGGRLRAETDRLTSFFWLVGGAFAMGAGIWSMHFIGMLAFVLPVPMTYNLVWTAFSMFIAVFVSGLALILIKRSKGSIQQFIWGGIILGIGIVSMHYTGMTAMLGHVSIHYLPSLFAISIVIAITASMVALWLALQSNRGTMKRQFELKFISALIMGAAICGMHYTGMFAAVFTPIMGAEMVMPVHLLEPRVLALYIAIITSIIAAIALIVSTYKQLMSGALQQEKEFLNSVLSNLEDGIMACDAKGTLTLLNQAMRKMCNLPQNANISRWMDYVDVFMTDGTTRLQDSELPLTRALNEKYIYGVDMIIQPKGGYARNVMVDGQSVSNSEGKKLGAVIALHDVTERKRMENELLKQATYDVITGLPNRSLLLDRLGQALTQSKRSTNLVAVLFLDLDGFKFVNDSLGHSIGDTLLNMVGRRLEKCIRETDTIARFGGDEFVAVITGLKKEEDTISVIQKIISSFTETFKVNDQDINITTSIGVSIYPKNAGDVESLLKNADTAMYRAKEFGRNNFKFYNEEMNLRTIKRLELESYLYHALEDRQFILYYQPLVDLNTGYIIGLEALIRWQHPTLGMVQPNDFIPLIEENDLIVPIGEWVLRSACAQNKAWQKEGLLPLRISVNISGKQLRKPDFVDMVRQILQETGLDPIYLELELTETSVIENTDTILETLNVLKSMGVKVALDDFGTGYSSLSYLKRLPVDKVKIDRSFIQDITTNSDDAAIVLTVIAMANSLKLRVVAEGMETEEQLGFLCFHKCDEVQGYHFSKPLTVEDCTELLKKNPKLFDPRVIMKENMALYHATHRLSDESHDSKGKGGINH